MSKLSVTSLPLELKRRIASFLSSGDAISLSQTCKSLHSSLALSSLSPSRLVLPELNEIGHWRTGNDVLRSIRLPVLQRRVHSLTLSFWWRDQGQGHRKGQVWIAGRPTSQPIQPDQIFQGGQAVCESPLATHTLEQQKMTFVPIEGQVYHLFYRVGDGGGHQLRIENGILHTIIFDDEERHIARNYRLLRQVGVIGPEMAGNNHASNFYPAMLMQVGKSIRRQLAAKEQPDHGLVSFLEGFSIPVNEDSLLAMEEIVQADVEERNLARRERQDAEAAENNNNNNPAVPAFPRVPWNNRIRLQEGIEPGNELQLILDAGNEDRNIMDAIQRRAAGLQEELDQAMGGVEGALRDLQ
jgi:hypothetical protein